MSHTVEIKSQIHDIEVLKESFSVFNWVIKENSKIRTYATDPLRDVVYDYVAINPTGQFDIGIKLVGDEYKLFGDFYDRTISQQLGSELGSLKQRYSLNIAKNFLEEEDLEYTVNEREDGMIEIEVEA